MFLYRFYAIGLLLCMLTCFIFADGQKQQMRGQHQEVADNCFKNGHRLYGRIQFVTSFPDIKAQVVTSFPDLKVKIVTSTPTKCGEWQIVNEFPVVKVQLVDSSPDIKIQFVQSFPGKPGRN